MPGNAEERLLEAIFGKRDEPAGKPSPEATARLKQKLEEVLTMLSQREREVIKLRYGLGDGHTYTLEEVGKVMRVTRERVRQIEARAVRKLMHPIRKEVLGGLTDAPSSSSEENQPEN